MKKYYFLLLYLRKYRLERLFQSVVWIFRLRAIDKTLYRDIKFIPKNRKRVMIEDPNLKFMKEYFSEKRGIPYETYNSGNRQCAGDGML